MNRKNRKISYGLITTSILLLGGIFAAPAAAQVGHPQFCRKDLTPDSSTWSTAVKRHSCGAVEIETLISLVFPCTPGHPLCQNPTPRPDFYVRARRVAAPNINFARTMGVYPNGSTVCALNPPTTNWTGWTLCTRGAPPPIQRVESLWVLVF